MHMVDAKHILSANNGMNLYRGCQHGCIYCDARSKCYQINHIFEDIEVKRNAPRLLESALKTKRRPCMIGTGSMSDPYIPLEMELELTRRCLEIIEKHGFGVTLLTKSDRVLRDLDLLARIHAKAKAVVQMTMTTFDEELCRILEPNVSTTRQRFEALKTFQAAGIPTVVWLCPLVPFLNDTPENLLGILDYCQDAGVRGIVNFGMGLTLREGNREYFYRKLDAHFPGLKEHYIRTYGNDYELPSPRAKELEMLFRRECRRRGILADKEEVFRYLNTLEEKQEQLSLF